MSYLKSNGSSPVHRATTHQLSPQVCFVLRRAWRKGSVSRKDIVAAFGVSAATATRVLATAYERYSSVLVRMNQEIRANRDSVCPDQANERTLLWQLSSGERSFAQLGLTVAELPVNDINLEPQLPPTPGVLSRIQQAITQRRGLRIQYVGLRGGESARWRNVLPQMLEVSCGQWRVIANDLDSAEHTAKVFVLTRILAADGFAETPKKLLGDANPVPRQIQVHVSLNARLTDDQKRAVRAELGINTDGVVTINDRNLFDFKHRFCDQAPNPDVVWPLITISPEA